jgi:hypothetical protein
MKQFIFLFTLICISSYSFGQFNLGIKTGFNLSKAVYLNDYNEELIQAIRKLKPGFSGGIFFRQTMNKVLSVEADILYSQKGLKTKQIPYNISVNTMNYIEIPVTGQYQITADNYRSLNISVGGFVAFWTDGKYKRTDLETSETEITKLNFYSTEYSYSRIDAGIIFELILRHKKSDLFVKYTRSMTGSAQDNTDALSNYVFSIGINYKIL